MMKSHKTKSLLQSGLSLQALCLLSSILLLVVGCQHAKVGEPLTDKLAGNDPDSQIEFWHALAERPVTSNDEAFHGLLLYTDREDPADSYDGRVSLLKERRMLPKGFDRPANESISRGVLAVALVRALEIKGGVTMHLLGPTPRYATRELMYMNLYPPSSPQQTFAGSEFVGIMGRVEDYQRVNPARSPAAVLPGEAEQAEKAKHSPKQGSEATPPQSTEPSAPMESDVATQPAS